MNRKAGEMPDRINVEIHYLRSDKRIFLKPKQNILLTSLAFDGDAILKFEHPDIQPKTIQINRLHSTPFPKKGGFCISLEFHAKSIQSNVNEVELIKIYSENYMEYYFLDEKLKKQRRSIHNIEKLNTDKKFAT